RDELAFLGDLPARIKIPPMPLQERVQLARALAARYQRKITDVSAWRPLLSYTQGNPLTITVLVGQALRDNLTTKDQIESFVAKLRAGQSAFTDDESQGRSQSLGASLSYGFDSAFTGPERKQLALLHFFQGFVDVDVLCFMGHPEADYCLPELRGRSRDQGIAILDRAAEIGLLTPRGGGYYSIHPALPWYFKTLFDQYYPNPLPATRAFVEAMGELGNFYHGQYGAGHRDVIAALTAEEPNLLHARHLARANAWWRSVISTMQGLDQLYDHTGRRADWARLVNEIIPDFVDPATDGPLPTREEEWSVVTQHRVRLARESLQLDEAARLQGICVKWGRRRAAPALAVPPQSLDGEQRNRIRTLAVSLEQLANIQRESRQPECIAGYTEALGLYERIGDTHATAVCAFNLAQAYLSIPAIRNLDQAEHHCQRSLDLHDDQDRLGRSKCYAQLGHVALERFNEAKAAQAPEAQLLAHLNTALTHYHTALDLLPPNAVADLAITHNQIGEIYRRAGDIDRALPHYRDAIRYMETQGDVYRAGGGRFNVAIALRQANRLPDALEYARAALRNFETFGPRAADMIAKTRQLIAAIESAMGPKPGT
ncbi:MAG: tetratricopeptide repeat protein, partial [Planctomycetota bacterium]|nr:tetratricopeptide repeat protein [Planctomycetota bacterium]